MAKLIDAIAAHPDVKCFCVDDSDGDEPGGGDFEPLDKKLLSDDEGDGYFVIQALDILPDGSQRACYMDVSLPERINDYALFVDGGELEVGYPHEFPGEIIPAHAMDVFGVYVQYYSRSKPEIGIEILKRGLAIAARKCYIAENLGYILRDEGRFAEAIEAFRIAADEGPSSYFIYAEIADAYGELGDVAGQDKYRALFEAAEAE